MSMSLPPCAYAEYSFEAPTNSPQEGVNVTVVPDVAATKLARTTMDCQFAAACSTSYELVPAATTFRAMDSVFATGQFDDSHLTR